MNDEKPLAPTKGVSTAISPSVETPVKETPTESTQSIGFEIDSFINQLEALNASLPLAVTILKVARFGKNEEFSKFLEKNGTLKSTTSAVKTYVLGPGVIGEAQRLKRKVERFERGAEILPRSFIVALISQFDHFVGRILRCLYYLKPELLHSSERQLTFAQLLEFGSIDDAREYLIEKEIETLLRKSHVEQFESLESKLSIQLRVDLPSWSSFIELTQRRNLFTHCNGLVSSQYLDVCDKHNVVHSKRPSVGEALSCPPKYFQEAFECTFEIGVKLAQVLWRKIRPDQSAEADSSLIDLSFELLLSEQYSLLIRIVAFFTQKVKNFSSDECRRMLIVNHAQAHKWLGKDDIARKLINKEDWTACGYPFKLAAAVLNDDFDSAAKLMRLIGISDDVKKKDYQEWPLFREFRKSAQFAMAFEAVFGEPFASSGKSIEVAQTSSEPRDIIDELVKIDMTSEATQVSVPEPLN